MFVHPTASLLRSLALKCLRGDELSKMCYKKDISKSVLRIITKEMLRGTIKDRIHTLRNTEKLTLSPSRMHFRNSKFHHNDKSHCFDRKLRTIWLNYRCYRSVNYCKHIWTWSNQTIKMSLDMCALYEEDNHSWNFRIKFWWQYTISIA